MIKSISFSFFPFLIEKRPSMRKQIFFMPIRNKKAHTLSMAWYESYVCYWLRFNRLE